MSLDTTNPIESSAGGADSLGLNEAMAGFNDLVLSQLKDADPELATQILNEAHADAAACLKQKTTEDLVAARAALEKTFDTIPKKISLMARVLVNSTLGKFAPEFARMFLGTNGLQAVSFDEEKERLKKEGGAVLAEHNNILYPRTDGFMGSLQILSRLSSLVGIGEKGDAIRVVAGSTLVVPQSKNTAEKGMLSVSVWGQLRYVGEGMEPPIHLRTKTMEQAASETPRPDEIFVVEVKNEMPAAAELAKARKLFARGKVQWYTPELSMALLKAEGASSDQAITAMGVLPFSDEYATLKASLDALDAPAAEATGLPRVDGKLDKVKLAALKKEYDEAATKDGYTKEELAAVYVLGGKTPERALRAAGIPSTDPTYAALKTDLETLKS